MFASEAFETPLPCSLYSSKESNLFTYLATVTNHQALHGFQYNLALALVRGYLNILYVYVLQQIFIQLRTQKMS